MCQSKKMANSGLPFLVVGTYVANTEQRGIVRRIHRHLRNTINPFDIPEDLFIKIFRFPKYVTRNIIEDLEQYVVPLKRSTGIKFELKVLASLQFFASGSYQGGVGTNYTLGLSQPTVSRCLSLVTNLIATHLMPEWVKFPQTHEDRVGVKSKFYEKFNFSGVIGAIDCSHVLIIAPPTYDTNYPGGIYINRKGQHSINVEVVCDADLTVTAINARYPGSSHDSGIWQTSAVQRHLRQRFEEGERSSWLIGDSGYPSQPWLLTTIVDADENSPEGRYTQMHCSTRNCIERCFGVWKQRFRCMLKHRVLHYSPAASALIIYSCAILHNIAVYHRLAEVPPEEGDPVEQDEDDHDPVYVPEADFNILRLGQAMRAMYISQHFS